MLLIHAADIHLGAVNKSKFSSEVSQNKKKEVRKAFDKMIDYAEHNNIKIIMLSGDVFDKDSPAIMDKEFFVNAIKNHPSIDFLYLKGNHDTTCEQINIDNLKTFSSTWSSYSYDDVTIYGIENTKNMYSSLQLNDNTKNIVMAHGDIVDKPQENGIVLNLLKNKKIDYLALGHIHKNSIIKVDKMTCVYPGCLEGRGFDEIGMKGFYVVDTLDFANPKFIANSIRVINEIEVDISEANDIYNAKEIVKRAIINIDKDSILRVILKGNIKFDDSVLLQIIQDSIADDRYFVNIKNETKREYDFKIYLEDKSIKGEFVRRVLSSDKYNDDEKYKIITLGIRALENKGEI